MTTFSSAVNAFSAPWQPAKGPLMTRWAKDVSPDKVLPEYPRPQLVRKDWTNLNGLWQYAVSPKDDPQPAAWDGQILVPFPIESALSGVMKPVTEKEQLWYRRTFARPSALQMPKDGRLLLHFGAVDWEATVYVNGKQVGTHRGGYTPFSFDITDALRPDGDQELVVRVWDPTSTSHQPRGKQLLNPQGIWYTPVTGIWQTVWLEPVEKTHIASLRMTPNLDKSQIEVTIELRGAEEHHQVAVTVGSPIAGREPYTAKGKPGAIIVPIKDMRLWSPDDPYLYQVTVAITGQDNHAGNGASAVKPQDSVRSYVGMRKIDFRKDEAGRNRLFLNNRPLFQYGPLDQGWWPDGLYTAPTDAALVYDIEVTKKFGMNMCRKHVKVEPARWYYHCDRLGLLVWQDMPSGDRYIRGNVPDIERSAESEATFRREWREIMDCTHHFPSVITYVPFNEGWGQFKTNELLDWTKKHDPTRLVDGPSGWTDRGAGDMHDMHMYPGPSMFPVSDKRVSVLGEFGGLGLPLAGHLWRENENWGYRTYKTREELQTNYEKLIRKLIPLIGKGLAAAIYTQTTDVESEVNGLMTYDRAVLKLDPQWAAALHKKLYQPQPTLITKSLVATSETAPQQWRYTTTSPAEGWTKPEFDDAAWEKGHGGFGTKDTPGGVPRTTWNAKSIWLRRTVELGAFDPANVQLRVHHDEDAEVYINGTLIARLPGYTMGYDEIELDGKGRAALRKGTSTIAVYCRQTRGGQYIDLGLVEVTTIKPAANGSGR